MNQRTLSEESNTSTGNRAPAAAPLASFYATASRDLVPLLMDELKGLGAVDMRRDHAGARFRGSLEVAYRACLWSRVASRVLLPLARVPADTPERLYEGVRGVRWEEHLAPWGTLAVDFVTSRSRIRHSRFGAQRVKDAVVDRLRRRSGERPSVSLKRPDLRINVHVDRDLATVAVDLAGESLHRRGYRRQAGAAPLKENVAAAMLLFADWPRVARAGGALLDPMCGSGTLLCEAALIAADAAPGLSRDYFGFLGWRGHDGALWERLVQEAVERRRDGLQGLPPLLGSDEDPRAIVRARENLAALGLAERATLAVRPLLQARPGVDCAVPGLVASNPPYGERLGDARALEPLYRQMGRLLKEHFPGWRAALLVADATLGERLGLVPWRSRRLDNGPLSCRLLEFRLPARASSAADAPLAGGLSRPAAAQGMFANRLRKNLRNIGRWARREGIECYRVYDADMPEYAFAVDVYKAEALWLVAQEYRAPAGVDPRGAADRRREVLATLEEVLEVPQERIVVKTRRRYPRGGQYQRENHEGELHEVRENGCRLLVNFTDRLDTGLFLDHRWVRRLVGTLARDRCFLNLFAYTGAATVHAAAGGAARTTSVDLSATYLDWARRNMALNDFEPGRHELVRDDCLTWLRRAHGRKRRYDLVLADCPTFSNSKRMRESFDTQRDHEALIAAVMGVLAEDGILIFSNHLKRFRMAEESLTQRGYHLRDISRRTIPKDFARNPRAHHCWQISRADHDPSP